MSKERIISLLRQYTGIIAVYLAMMLTVLDGTIVNVALPTLTKVFGVTESSTVWIVNAYQLVITMFLLSFASLGDIYGYRRVFQIGVVLFTIASGCCALSQSLEMLVCVRIVQGIGAAAIMSVNMALVRMIYPASKLGRGMGVNAMVVSLSTVTGPTLAGAILAIASWHWLFLINIPVGIAAFIIGHKYLPRNVRPDKSDKFDGISAVECALMLGLLVNVIEGFSRATDRRLIIAESVVLLVIGYFMIRRQRKRAFPLMPIDLLKIPIFSMSICTSVASFAAQMLAMVSLPFMMTNVWGCDALKIGLLLSPWPVGVMIAAPLAGRLVERVHAGLLGAIGMGVFALGLFMLYLLPAEAPTWQIIWRMAICGLGFGTFQTPNNVTMASSAPRNRSGAAGGMQGSARVLGQTLGTTLVAVIYRVCANGIAGHVCLLIAMGTAILAGVFSSLRLTQPSPYKNQVRNKS